ncbi:MAG: copper-binding protein [Deltaproteobacteria bacterium]|nr:copper-binding protein [Deltaproteobacteria bacterium]
MKRVKLLLAFVFLGLFVFAWAPLALAQDHSGHGADVSDPPTGRLFETKAVIVELDRANGRIVAKHDPIPQVGWEAMTMGFLVEDPTMLGDLAPGDEVTLEIRFAPDAGPQGYLVVGIDK